MEKLFSEILYEKYLEIKKTCTWEEYLKVSDMYVAALETYMESLKNQ